MTVPQDDARWRKSRRSQDQGACVELHPVGALRDSKNPTGPTLGADLTALVRWVKADR